MDLYLVRHGETNANTKHVYQSPTEPLSRMGAAEVARLVRKVKEIEPTHIYTSDFKRARETAHYFGYATGLEPQWLPTLHEVHPPEYIVGRSHYGPSSMWYVTRWFFNFFDKQGDLRAETRQEFIDRVLAARDYFATHHQQGDRIIAVTHSVFTNFFLAHLCRDGHINPISAMALFVKILRYENSGITHIRHLGHNEVKICPWQVHAYNEAKHLELDI